HIRMSESQDRGGFTLKMRVDEFTDYTALDRKRRLIIQRYNLKEDRVGCDEMHPRAVLALGPHHRAEIGSAHDLADLSTPERFCILPDRWNPPSGLAANIYFSDRQIARRNT